MIFGKVRAWKILSKAQKLPPLLTLAWHESEDTLAVQNMGIQTKSVNMETSRGAAHVKTKQHSHRATGLSRNHFGFGWS